MQDIPSDAETLHDAGAIALDEHVGSLDKAEQQLATRVCLEVQGHAALVAVDGVEQRTLALDERRGPTHVVAGLRLLDLDHVGSHIGEQHRAVGAGQQPRQVEEADSRQRHGEFNSPRTLVGDFRRSPMR